MQKRAPALLDNLIQAFLMAPFFVLLEVTLHLIFRELLETSFAELNHKNNILSIQVLMLFHYEPYPGFRKSVEARIEAEIKEWQDEKKKKTS